MSEPARPVISGISYTVGTRLPLAKLATTEQLPAKDIQMLEARGLRHFCEESRAAGEVLWQTAAASLASAGLTPGDLDGILVAGSPLESQELLRSLNGAGLDRAWLIGLGHQECSGSEGALRVASDLVMGGGRARRLLLFLYGKVARGESRLGWNGDTVFSDGALSCVVSNSGRGLQILSSEVLTNPKLTWYRSQESEARYYEECVASLTFVASSVLRTAGLDVAEISRVFATNGNRSYHNTIAATLGISHKKLHSSDIGELGHVFSCDGLIGLSGHLASAGAQPGECFMLVSWSPFVMGATILRCL